MKLANKALHLTFSATSPLQKAADFVLGTGDYDLQEICSD